MTISWEREKERWAASPNPALNQRNANQPPSSHRIFFVQPPSDGDQGEEEKLDTSKECGVSHLVVLLSPKLWRNSQHGSST